MAHRKASSADPGPIGPPSLKMMEDIRAAIVEDRLEDYRKDFYNRYDMTRNF